MRNVKSNPKFQNTARSYWVQKTDLELNPIIVPAGCILQEHAIIGGYHFSRV